MTPQPDQARLIDFCDVVQGGRLKLSGKHFVDTGYPAYGAGGINGFLPSYEFEKPAVILSAIGARCGKCFMPDGKWASLANTQLIFPDTTCADVRFLWYQLNEESSWHRSGTGQPFIKPSDVKNRLAYLPALSEQKRIAAILDAADALRAKRRESIDQLDSLVKAHFLEMFGDPVTNPKGWSTCTLGTLGQWRTGGTPPRNHPAYFTGDVPWFSSGELNSMYLGSNSKERITESAVKESAAKWIPVGSLMLGMYDTAALKAAISAAKCACNQAVAFSLLHAHLSLPPYVYSAITIGREHFRRLQRGVRQKNLNLAMIRAITIPIPPLSSQNRFASVVESIERQKAQMKAHLTELDALFASIQSRVFHGGRSS